MAAFDPATRLGSTLRGKWTLERLLGTGGMAAVYVGAHKIGRRDAIKLLHPEVAAIRDLRERFEQEAHAVNRFRHAGAVEVRDIDVADDGAPFLVMELLEGESLLERVRGRGVTTPELLRWVDELLDVLAAAHASGIVHRDIKPDNLFLARDPAAPSGERLKVLDFGIARLREGARSRTALGARLGTVAYMPPEQVRGGAVDHRVDLFATGATMFRLLARRRIHEASTEGELLGLMATTPAPPLRSVAPEIPERIALVVDRALAFDARDRYPDATSMQLDVRAVREGRDPPFATEQRAAGLGGARQGEPTVRRSERPLAEAPTEAPAERRAPSAGARSTSVTVPAVTLDAPTLRRDDAADEATTQERAPRPLGVEPEPFPSTKAPGQGAERQGLAPLAESVAVLAQQAARPASGAAPAAEDGGHQPLENQPFGHQPLENQPFGHQPLGHQPSGHQPSGHQPSGHQPSGRQPSGHQPSGHQPSMPQTTAALEGQGPTLPSAPGVRVAAPTSGPAVAIVTAAALSPSPARASGEPLSAPSLPASGAWPGRAPASEAPSRVAVAVGVAERRPAGDRSGAALLVGAGVVALVAVGALVMYLATGGDDGASTPREGPASPPREADVLPPGAGLAPLPRPVVQPGPSARPSAPAAATSTQAPAPPTPSAPPSTNPAAPESSPAPRPTAAPPPTPNPARPSPAPTATAAPPTTRPTTTPTPSKEPPGSSGAAPGKGRGKDKDK